MSSDVELYKVVSPENATCTFELEDNPRLHVFQARGLLNVKFLGRIGRNCMNDRWHYEEEQVYHTRDGFLKQLDNAKETENNLRFFTRDWDQMNGFNRFLATRFNEEEGSWFDKDKLEELDWDIIHICW